MLRRRRRRIDDQGLGPPAAILVLRYRVQLVLLIVAHADQNIIDLRHLKIDFLDLLKLVAAALRCLSQAIFISIER